MNSRLNEFFREERKRFFEPGPFFTERLFARLSSERVAPLGVWGWVPGAVRPVLALSLVILFVILTVQIVVPVTPSRAALEPYRGQGLSGEQLLFADPQFSASTAQFEELMILEPTE